MITKIVLDLDDTLNTFTMFVLGNLAALAELHELHAIRVHTLLCHVTSSRYRTPRT